MLRAPMPSPGAVLRERLGKGILVIPGAYDAITALSAARAGAEALYLSGAGLTNSSLGLPDIALATLSEFASRAAAVCQAAPVPVIADADTGFGEAWNVARTVIEYERAGLAGLHLEDQVSPKRCGHLDGKACIPPEHMDAKLRAAIDAKRDSSFFVIARTDARGVEGLDAAIERAQRYEAAGADGIFPEGLQSEQEFETFRAAVRIPLMANMTEFGKTPLIPAARFADMGYEMVIFPMTAFRCMLAAVDDCYRELLRTGTQAGFLDKMRTRAELYELLEYDRYSGLDERWAAEARAFESEGC